jgi:hypothetical protein
MVDKYSDIEVYINCSGKSGSKTLEKTLSKYYKCLHTHGNYYFSKYISKDNINLYDCVKESMKMHKNVYIIDSYRTPFERAFSSSFQNNKNTTVENFNNNLIIGENYSCIDETLYEFNLNLPDEFDFEKKYIEIIHENLHIIKLRLNDINDWGNILSNIFCKEIIIESENLSKDKIYYDNYKVFLENITIPRQYFDNIINSKDFKYYNTTEEQNNYINKWKNRINDAEVIINNLPEDFDWKIYVDINRGRLQNMTELEVKIHYSQTGQFEGKKYKYD